ncbi:hypothetical protein BLNAU_16316 [Blattamonas nauphoetae]|uniref:Uncharacterized protein n=1 Tax=Blattamonas nauphoetae TaxID=2049346 RepID=A0ABQ9XA41_9EUKA|nr:hypothetical protein BLNAU_18885 [Blattamonas nauphoetae]KAK2948781.1 hypothetical protein BLNAU_16316 [Blattamonas nauphoetae]
MQNDSLVLMLNAAITHSPFGEAADVKEWTRITEGPDPEVERLLGQINHTIEPTSITDHHIPKMDRALVGQDVADRHSHELQYASYRTVEEGRGGGGYYDAAIKSYDWTRTSSQTSRSHENFPLIILSTSTPNSATLFNSSNPHKLHHCSLTFLQPSLDETDKIDTTEVRDNFATWEDSRLD